MALKIDTKFEEKLTCASKNDMRSFANFRQSTFESLKSEDLCVMKIKNGAKIKENLTCQFKIDMKNLMIFHPST